MKVKTPTRKGEGLEALAGQFQSSFTLVHDRVQRLVAHNAAPIATVAVLAAIAWRAL
jgi:hypothetical protein